MPGDIYDDLRALAREQRERAADQRGPRARIACWARASAYDHAAELVWEARREADRRRSRGAT
jgi:hypothetical protein